MDVMCLFVRGTGGALHLACTEHQFVATGLIDRLRCTSTYSRAWARLLTDTRRGIRSHPALSECRGVCGVEVHFMWAPLVVSRCGSKCRPDRRLQLERASTLVSSHNTRDCDFLTPHQQCGADVIAAMTAWMGRPPRRRMVTAFYLRGGDLCRQTAMDYLMLRRADARLERCGVFDESES